MKIPLKNFLSKLRPGPLHDTTALEELLKQVWESIHGSDSGGLQGYKLTGRLEKVQWQPPYLTFSISTWTAQIVSKGHRQLHASAKRLHIREPAKRIADAIFNNLESQSLKRYPDGRVKVLIGTVIPAEGYQQTVAGRRRRFRALLEKLLAERGWFPVANNTYMQTISP
ncbi:MAG TPA: hypothetical protein VKD89_04950 [Candidatus Udaeobacter sp.]|nr:hypothetical protein [Candidatus Udaeobacter sp.]